MLKEYGNLIENLGIEKGDILDVSSDMASTSMYFKNIGLRLDADVLLDTLKDVVGQDGTILIRTFNWDFCHGTEFDVRKSPSRVGALGNKAMKRDDFRRTQHPIYSWMVWGKYTQELCDMNNASSFDPNGPFGFFYKKCAKQLTIGDTSIDPCTQMHYAEAIAGVPYRFDKTFEGNYVDLNGQKSIRRYSMHVRPLNLNMNSEEIYLGKNAEEIKRLGIMREVTLSDNMKSSIVLLKELTDYLVNDIQNNEGKGLVSIDGIPGFKNSNTDWNMMKYINN